MSEATTRSPINTIQLIQFSLIYKSCIDRAAQTALESVPAARAAIIRKSLQGAKGALPSPEVFDSIVYCTTGGEDERDIPDESSKMFAAIFIDEFVRLAGSCLIRDSNTAANVYEKVVIYFCASVCLYDLDLSLEHICPYDISAVPADSGKWEPVESEHVMDSSWKCVALQQITLSDVIRQKNAMVEYNDAMFVKKLTAMTQ